MTDRCMAAAKASHSARPSNATSITSSIEYQGNGGVATASATPVITTAPRHGWSGSLRRMNANAVTASTPSARAPHAAHPPRATPRLVRVAAADDRERRHGQHRERRQGGQPAGHELVEQHEPRAAVVPLLAQVNGQEAKYPTVYPQYVRQVDQPRRGYRGGRHGGPPAAQHRRHHQYRCHLGREGEAE